MFSRVSRKSDRRAAFTLTEVLISMALMLVLSVASLTGIVAIARGNHALGNYTVMNAESRLILEQVGQDVRQFTTLTSASASELGGTLPAASGAGVQSVVYTYDSSTQTLTRSVDGVAQRTFRDIDTLAFSFTKADGSSTTTLSMVKQVQLNGRIKLKLGGTAHNTARILTAQFTLRSI